MAPLHILLVGTCDTKLNELLYLRSQILATSSDSFKRVTLIDVGRTPSSDPAITVPQKRVLDIYHEVDQSAARLDLATAPRGEVTTYMAKAATVFVQFMLEIDPDRGSIHGIISAGGSGNTALAAQVMRDALPVGFPKLIVSTIASGDTSQIVGETDITMTYSVVDVAGLNALLRGVLDNAAGAIVGMATAHRDRSHARKAAEPRADPDEAAPKTRLGITMFGVTTPCVDEVRRILEKSYPDVEPYIFHATGHGGRAMENLIGKGELDAVLDLTTTEIGDHIVGGNMSAGLHRLEAALARGIPYLISLGACDMINFGPEATVPEEWRQVKRNLLVHNSQVTLMRTSVEECGAIGAFIVDKIKRYATDRSRVAVWIPRGGVSMLSTAGQAFEDKAADRALFTAVTEGLKGTAVKVIESEMDINDPATAKELVSTLTGLMSQGAG